MQRLIKWATSSVLAISCLSVHAQQSHLWPGGVFYMNYFITDNRFGVETSMSNSVPDTMVWKVLDGKYPASTVFINPRPESPIMLAVHWVGYAQDPYLTDVPSLSKVYHSYRMVDSSDGAVIALGITTGNAPDYRYHIVADDSVELVPWSPVRLGERYGAKRPYADLGRWYLPGKRVLVEVVNTKNYGIREGVILDWKPTAAPRVTELDVVEVSGKYFNLHSDLGKPYAGLFDAATGLPGVLRLPVDSVASLSLNFEQHLTTPYEISLIAGKDTTQLAWWFLAGSYRLKNGCFSRPGHYTLLIRPIGVRRLDTAHPIWLSFDVLPHPVQNVPLRAVLIVAGCFALAAAAYLVFSRRRLYRLRKDRQRATLRLQSLRAQLNPHFMVNALTSIQHLMNHNDTDGANRYLRTFAGLTRRVLLAGDEDRISLEDEAALLRDYLEMEQLRFGFDYAIDIDPALDAPNIEIPSMLLQPFVENAVKHGVSVLGTNGRIGIAMTRRENDVILSVADNGQGFDISLNKQHAFGLRLAGERIALFNRLYKGSILEPGIESGATGTTVRITLKQWL